MSFRKRITETALAVFLASTVAAISAGINNPGVQQSGAVTANHCVKWGPGTGQVQDAGANCASQSSGANPTATAGPTAVNGAATTFMRSDAAPAVQLGTNAAPGIVQADNVTIKSTLGVIAAQVITFGPQTVAPGGTAAVQGNGALVQLSTGTATTQHCVKFDANGNTVDNGAACATQSSGANPTATAGDAAVNGSATTFMRSDAAPAIQLASATLFGLAKVDNSTITAAAGIVTAKINAILPTPTRAGDVIYWNGTTWVSLAGNNSGTQVLSENASGVLTWAAAGTGTVTSAQISAGAGISVATTSGANPCVTSCNLTVAQSLTNTILDANPADPASTTSTTGVMMGLGTTCKLTPSYSTRVHITVDGVLSATATARVFAIGKFGTGTAPINGAAFSGTTFGGTRAVSIGATFTDGIPFSTSAVITGLTPATAYWFDIDLSGTSGTITVQSVHCAIFEF